MKIVSVVCPWEEYQMKKDGADGSILVMDVNGISNEGGYPTRFLALCAVIFLPVICLSYSGNFR